MLSDSLFEGYAKIIEDVARYAMTDYKYQFDDPEDDELNGPLFYDENTYWRTLESLIPLKDTQMLLDRGCDPCECRAESPYRYPEIRNELMGRIMHDVVDTMQELHKEIENAKLEAS